MPQPANEERYAIGTETLNEPAGRVEVDSQGNRVWRWAREVLDSTSVLLKRLDNKTLALEPTQKVPVISGTDAAAKRHSANRGSVQDDGDEQWGRHPALHKKTGGRDSGGGFDPYNSR